MRQTPHQFTFKKDTLRMFKFNRDPPADTGEPEIREVSQKRAPSHAFTVVGRKTRTNDESSTDYSDDEQSAEDSEVTFRQVRRTERTERREEKPGRLEEQEQPGPPEPDLAEPDSFSSSSYPVARPPNQKYTGTSFSRSVKKIQRQPEITATTRRAVNVSLVEPRKATAQKFVFGTTAKQAEPEIFDRTVVYKKRLIVSLIEVRGAGVRPVLSPELFGVVSLNPDEFTNLRVDGGGVDTSIIYGEIQRQYIQNRAVVDAPALKNFVLGIKSIQNTLSSQYCPEFFEGDLDTIKHIFYSRVLKPSERSEAIAFLGKFEFHLVLLSRAINDQNSDRANTSLPAIWGYLISKPEPEGADFWGEWAELNQRLLRQDSWGSLAFQDLLHFPTPDILNQQQAVNLFSVCAHPVKQSHIIETTTRNSRETTQDLGYSTTVEEVFTSAPIALVPTLKLAEHSTYTANEAGFLIPMIRLQDIKYSSTVMQPYSKYLQQPTMQTGTALKDFASEVLGYFFTDRDIWQEEAEEEAERQQRLELEAQGPIVNPREEAERKRRVKETVECRLLHSIAFFDDDNVRTLIRILDKLLIPSDSFTNFTMFSFLDIILAEAASVEGGPASSVVWDYFREVQKTGAEGDIILSSTVSGSGSMPGYPAPKISYLLPALNQEEYAARSEKISDYCADLQGFLPWVKATAKLNPVVKILHQMETIKAMGVVDTRASIFSMGSRCFYPYDHFQESTAYLLAMLNMLSAVKSSNQSAAKLAKSVDICNGLYLLANWDCESLGPTGVAVGSWYLLQDVHHDKLTSLDPAEKIRNMLTGFTAYDGTITEGGQRQGYRFRVHPLSLTYYFMPKMLLRGSLGVTRNLKTLIRGIVEPLSSLHTMGLNLAVNPQNPMIIVTVPLTIGRCLSFLEQFSDEDQLLDFIQNRGFEKGWGEDNLFPMIADIGALDGTQYEGGPPLQAFTSFLMGAARACSGQSLIDSYLFFAALLKDFYKMQTICSTDTQVLVVPNPMCLESLRNGLTSFLQPFTNQDVLVQGCDSTYLDRDQGMLILTEGLLLAHLTDFGADCFIEAMTDMSAVQSTDSSTVLRRFADQYDFSFILKFAAENYLNLYNNLKCLQLYAARSFESPQGTPISSALLGIDVFALPPLNVLASFEGTPEQAGGEPHNIAQTIRIEKTKMVSVEPTRAEDQDTIQQVDEVYNQFAEEAKPPAEG